MFARRRMEGHRFSHAPTARTAARSMAIRASMFGRWTLITTCTRSSGAGVAAGSTGGTSVRSMDLSERCRRQRHLVNRGELFSQRTAELAFDDGAHRGERLGRNFVLQAGQFRRDFCWQHVDARGKELPHLDEDTSHLDRELSKADRDSMEPSRARLFDACPESQARQEPLPKDQSDRDARKEDDDAAVACGGQPGRPGLRWHAGIIATCSPFTQRSIWLDSLSRCG